MLEIKNKVQVLHSSDWASCLDKVLLEPEPRVLKGFISTWPIVKKGLQSPSVADKYLRRFYNKKNVGIFEGDSSNAGRYFYNEDLSGFNYQQRRGDIELVLDALLAAVNDESPATYYVGSAGLDSFFPGFRKENDIEIPLPDNINPLVSIWIGNRATIACHYDAPNNLACCAMGKRRFTLFPPEQIENLYPGPVDKTPAGQTISLVNFDKPDYEKFPRFKDALQVALLAELEPGDALWVPSMWWHHVQSFSAYNILVNYWWRNSPSYMGVAAHALEHAMLSIRDLPERERQAWKSIFDFYVFGDRDKTIEHIPKQARGLLADMDVANARQLRSKLLNNLNR